MRCSFIEALSNSEKYLYLTKMSGGGEQAPSGTTQHFFLSLMIVD
jgi:hypothetical protein